MSLLKLDVLGKSELLERFQRRREAIISTMRTAMLLQMVRLANYVKTRKLSGQVLRNRTGTLRRSIVGTADVHGGEITGAVGTNVSYARAHEFGGQFNVPGHWRTQSQAWGRDIAPRSVFVRSHVMTMPQRSFLRSSLLDRKEAIQKELQGAALRAMANPP
jgi:phage gpG-like protein